MGKPRSPETEVRYLKSQLRMSNQELSGAKMDASRLRVRLNSAEAEVADWKRRFDALLARTPEVPRG